MSTAPMPLAEALKGARQRLAAFLAGLEPESRITAFCHHDADGLAAGAVFGRALHRMGFTRVEVVASLRGESAFSEEARARLLGTLPQALVVIDLGMRRDGVLPNLPTVYLDHHRPSGTASARRGPQQHPIGARLRSERQHFDALAEALPCCRGGIEALEPFH